MTRIAPLLPSGLRTSGRSAKGQINVSVSTNGLRTTLGRTAIADAARAALRAERVSNALVSITMLDRRGIARMNKRHIGHTGPTDVISFGFVRATPADPVIGDVYIAPEVARENAKASGVTVRDELTRLVVHGVLHILGYDHPESDARTRSDMWRRQERIVRRLAGARPR
jgi:probable rRNA maturation factor